jgi:hypothetical protein
MPSGAAAIRRLSRPHHAADGRDRESGGANNNLEHDCLHRLDGLDLRRKLGDFKLQIGHSSSIHCGFGNPSLASLCIRPSILSDTSSGMKNLNDYS